VIAALVAVELLHALADAAEGSASKTGEAA
jgi:hypothetical protein